MSSTHEFLALSERIAVVSESGSFMQRHYFLLRRLHSLTGILPIGVFLLVHLTTNSSIVWGLVNKAHYSDGHAGAATFQHEVNFIHSLPFLALIEVFGLWVPIAFHSILGVIYARTGHGNTRLYPYADNWRYSLQRVSGYVGVFFIFYHVATLRWGWTWLVPGGAQWSAEFSASTLAAAMQGSTEGVTVAGVVVGLFYMLGVSLLVFHLANGLWTAAITWGLTVTVAAQKRWGYVCAALGVALMGMAWSAVVGFMMLDYHSAQRAEISLLESHSAPAQPHASSEADEAGSALANSER